MSKKYFGTDGIRGRTGSALLNPAFVLKLGWAAGKVLSKAGFSRVVVGKDTRLSGYLFESALEAGLAAAGVNVMLLGPMPTPAIAFLTKMLRAQAGVVVSASHNSYEDNGIKFFGSDGMKLSDQLEEEIEYYIDQPMHCVDPSSVGKAKRLDDAAGRYVQFCRSILPRHLNLSGLSIVVDCAHGATYQVAPQIFEELDATIASIGVSPDGFNINDGVGATNTLALQQAVKAHQADLGVAFDGDGDRLIMVDHMGDVVDGDDILYILASAAVNSGAVIPGVVGTVMSNLGLEQALSSMNIPFDRAQVGDRHVMTLLKSHDWYLGGEPSGHILNLNHVTTGDGIITALQVLSVMQGCGQSLQQLRSGLHKRPHILISVPVKDRVDLNAFPSILQSVQATESDLGDTGRVLLRPSGTELCVRVMVEGEDESIARAHAKHLAEVITEAVG